VGSDGSPAPDQVEQGVAEEEHPPDQSGEEDDRDDEQGEVTHDAQPIGARRVVSGRLAALWDRDGGEKPARCWCSCDR
jgi:hypothetical protein